MVMSHYTSRVRRNYLCSLFRFFFLIVIPPALSRGALALFTGVVCHCVYIGDGSKERRNVYMYEIDDDTWGGFTSILHRNLLV